LKLKVIAFFENRLLKNSILLINYKRNKLKKNVAFGEYNIAAALVSRDMPFD